MDKRHFDELFHVFVLLAGYVGHLMVKVNAIVSTTKRDRVLPDVRPCPPALSASCQHPDKGAAVQAHVSRFIQYNQMESSPRLCT